jgi:hypothetical protein
VIEPFVNKKAVHVPSTPYNNGSKLNDPFEPQSKSNKVMTIIINITYESSANTKTIQDPSTPCTTASINDYVESTPSYVKQKNDWDTKPKSTYDRNYVETEPSLPRCDPSYLA